VIYALILASVIGLVVGVGVLDRAAASRPYPFGPWLALGAVIAILASEPDPRRGTAWGLRW
jgi:prepilin signal peptidase PulO-like enzyme (type II secretory pathway)